MAIRKIIFAEGDYYHVYNRGTDKRDIFSDGHDFDRFLESMIEFNTIDPIGSIYEHSFQKRNQKIQPEQEDRLPIGGRSSEGGKAEKLVNIIAYCLNQNHYHFILQQVAEKGIEKFMQRLGTGYTKYFNHRYDRTGNLFQGKFKAIHVQSNEYLLHLSAYVNLNFKVHQLGSKASKSSWGEYQRSDKTNFSSPQEILEQFHSPKEYQDFANSSLEGVLARRGKIDPTLLLE